MIDSSSLALSAATEPLGPARSFPLLSSEIKYQLGELDSFAAPTLSSLDSKIEPVLSIGSDKDLSTPSVANSPAVSATDCDSASPSSDASSPLSTRAKTIPSLTSLDIANALPQSLKPTLEASPLRLRADSSPFSVSPSPPSHRASAVRKTQSMSALPVSSRRACVPSCAACRAAVPVPMFVKETSCQTLSFCSFRCFRTGPKV